MQLQDLLAKSYRLDSAPSHSPSKSLVKILRHAVTAV
ncbi:hypothetical protein PsyrH_12850 [Pseudomonas syringae pv. syringae HS191]|nr:hypothetical protein PsyrH_12850 [Pseudomonas syringae pv. syringae HS191]RML68192.1 hypothetical protein ALQ91_00818 [Pseudomonas syringae pv. syringae]